MTCVVLVAVVLGGCDRPPPHPPETCGWAATPSDITEADLIGEYYGVGADGTPTAMTLTADGHFAVTNYKFRDWYSETWIPLDTGSTWRVEGNRRGFVDRVRDKVRKQPVSWSIQLDDRADTTLKVGGTRADPVLYDAIYDFADSCDEVFSLLRRR